MEERTRVGNAPTGLRVGWRSARIWMRGRSGDDPPGDAQVATAPPSEINTHAVLSTHAAEPGVLGPADALAVLGDEQVEPVAVDPLQALSDELDGSGHPTAVEAPRHTELPPDPFVSSGDRGAGRRRLQVTLAVLLALACATAAVMTIRAFVATPGNHFPGVIQPSQAISLDFSEAGYLSSVRPSPGDRVRAGELLARLTPLGVHSLKLAQQAAAAAVASAKQRLTVAEQSVTGLPGARLAGVLRAKAQLVTDQARLAQVLALLDQTTIRSPVNGVVTNVSGAVGDFIEPSGIASDGTDQPTQLPQTPVVSLFSTASHRSTPTDHSITNPLIELAAGPTEMAAQVPESAIRTMRPGREAKVSVPALGATLRARLLRVVPDPVQMNGEVSYEVLFVLQQPASQVLPGMSANVTLNP